MVEIPARNSRIGISIVHDAYGKQRFDQGFDQLTGFRTRNVLGVPVVNSKGWTVGAVQADNRFDGVLDTRMVNDGDYVSVYPRFESLDIRPMLRVRERPLREPRFIADAHLAALARYLRMRELIEDLKNTRWSNSSDIEPKSSAGKISTTEQGFM